MIWSRSSGWTLQDASLRGASHYHLPGILGWFTANIGVHHVHHLNSLIPFYRLSQVLRDNPELDEGRISVAGSFRGLGLVLWDEASQRLISFRELAKRPGPPDAVLASS